MILRFYADPCMYLFVDDWLSLLTFTNFYTATFGKAVYGKVVYYGRLRSFKIIEISTKQKHVCDFLLGT